MPGYWIAKSIRVVVPPNSAERLTSGGRGGREIAVAHDGRRNVRMGFDAAGHNHLAGGIYYPAGLVAQRSGRCDCRYFVALHCYVPIANTHGCYHLSAADDHVQHKNAPCPSLVRALPQIYAAV